MSGHAHDNVCASRKADKRMKTVAKAAGYSGTPLARKLGILAGSRVVVMAAPGNYRLLLAPLPPGVRFQRTVGDSTDVVHLFTKSRAHLSERLGSILPKFRPDAAIWVSWPKKSSKVATDVTEDVVRAIALPIGLVDVKVCAVDETWSGLKLVVRLANRR
jgi:hypothetical protein